MASNDQDKLIKSLRRFSSRAVKMPQKEVEWAKEKICNYLEPILALCRKNNSELISHHEYTGSFYEKLKTETPDEIDIMVALKGKEKDFHLIKQEPGYAKLKVKDLSSPLNKYTSDGCLIPDKVRQAFFGLIQKTIHEFKNSKEEESLKADIKVSANGPAVTIVITDKHIVREKKNKKNFSLSADLVPSLLLSNNEHYVAKPKPEEEPGKSTSADKSHLWRQSFSLMEKELIKKMDKPQGCRHELVRITKTLRRKDPTLAKLSSYHIKTAFLNYHHDKAVTEGDWDSNMLGTRFTDFLKFILEKLQEHNLPNYFIPELNLLQEFAPGTIKNIERRLKTFENLQECIKIINKL